MGLNHIDADGCAGAREDFDLERLIGMTGVPVPRRGHVPFVANVVTNVVTAGKENGGVSKESGPPSTGRTADSDC